MKFTDYLVLVLFGLAVAALTQFVSIAAGLSFAFTLLLSFLFLFVRDARSELSEIKLNLIIPKETPEDRLLHVFVDAVTTLSADIVSIKTMLQIQQIREGRQVKTEEQKE